MALLTKGMWVVVADGEKAVILENRGDTRKPDLHQVERIDAGEVIMNSDRPGRVHESIGESRSSMDTPDFGRLNAEKLVDDLLENLGKRAAKGEFQQIVIAAPPQVLGAIRDGMGDALRRHVVCEMDKTLTKHPLAKIAEIVADELSQAE